MTNAAHSLSFHDLMFAIPRRVPFDRPGWIFERKRGGLRIMVRRIREGVDVASRNGEALNLGFPEVVAAAEALPNGTVLDAELVVPDEHQRPSFELLQQRTRLSYERFIEAAAWRYPAMVYVFDCLALAGRDMRGQMLLARRSASAELVANMTTFRALCFVEGKGKLAFDMAVAEGAQAIVAKRARSIYQRGQQSSWIKIRNPTYTP